MLTSIADNPISRLKRARYDDEHLLLTPLDHEGFRYNRNEVRKKSKYELLHLIQL